MQKDSFGFSRGISVFIFLLLTIGYSASVFAYPTHTLTKSQWSLISLPADPGGSGTVQSLFGDDLSADKYGSSADGEWVMYAYDSSAGQYRKIEIDELLLPNTGYYIIQRISDSVELDVPDTLSALSGSSIAGCAEDKKCVAHPLVSNDSGVVWNLVGYSSEELSAYGDSTFVTPGGCENGCSPDNALSAGVANNVLYRLNAAGTAYDIVTTDTQMRPWDAYWLAVLPGVDSLNWVLPVGTGDISDPEDPEVPNDLTEAMKIEISQSQASHFLAQASMGGTIEAINSLASRIRAIGLIPACEEWIDEQFAIPRGDTLASIAYSMSAADEQPRSDNAIQDHWDLAWWDDALNSEEQLRHRMGFALSQIAVVSTNYWQGLTRNGRWIQHVHYYDRLMNVAFGSHREFLNDVTYSSMMGVWLTYAQNSKSLDDDVFPDENYAREIMQLFSIGVYELDAYGDLVTDADGNIIENYNDKHVEEFAQVFTGLGLTNRNGRFFGQDLTLLGSPVMTMHQAYHDTTTKELLGVVLPANQAGNDDIAGALDNLSNHPSAAPFFSRLLMQRLTSSNPSREYIKRVTDAWYGNGPYGSTVGNFQSVIKAILLDTEARNPVTYSNDNGILRARSNNPLSGKIKEPLLKMTHLYRLAQPVSQSADGRSRIARSDRAVGQAILAAPTVFNFYRATHTPVGGPLGEYIDANGGDFDVTVPEAQILGQNVIAEFASIHNTLLNGPADSVKPNGATSTSLSHVDELKQGRFATDAELIKHLNIMLCHGQVPHEMAIDIENSLSTTGDREQRVAEILAVMTASPACSVTL